jgi:hypothetical protein
MRETTWIIDSQSGALTVEGLQQSELAQLATDLLAPGKQANCAPDQHRATATFIGPRCERRAFAQGLSHLP